MSFTPLLTDRLLLRPFCEADFIDLAVLFADPEVMRYVGNGQPRSPEQAAQHLQWMIEHQATHGFSLWAVIRRIDDRLIGQCGLWHLDRSNEIELGYKFARDCWGQGYATEASRAVITYGFETLELPELCGITHPDNFASQRILQKLGMTYEKTDRFYGQLCRYYRLSRDQWKDSSSGSATC